MKTKKLLYIGLMILGLALVCMGGFVLDDEGVKELSGICIGVGAGLFGLAAGQLIMERIIEKHPETKRKINIDAHDERNMRINDMARSKAFQIMGMAYGILALVFVLMGEPLLTVLLVIGTYLIGWVAYFVYLGKYAKEM